MSLLHHHIPSITLLRKLSPKPKTQLPSIAFTFKKLHSTISPIRSSSQPPPKDEDSSETKPSLIADEWGEKTEPEPEPEPATRFSAPDPPPEGDLDDEWGGNGTPAVEVNYGGGDDDKLGDLKMAFVDTVYGSDFGFKASAEIRAEAVELISQLEAANPTPAPTESPELLDGTWVLVYTAFSELLPLLATGSLPLLKVEKITQSIDSSSLIIDNSVTISSPVASFTFSASAGFEVRSPSRIQVQFKEGSFKAPELKSSIDLPESVELFGQKISLSPVQQTLNPLQNVVFGIAGTISGQPPLKVPIPGERSASWLLTTYLDKDLRVSRGDGGLFVLAREGSPLLDR